MSLPHYFLQEQVIAHEGEACFALRLTPDDAKHMKVARMVPGEHLAVIDAACDYFECEIMSFEQGLPSVRICQKLPAREDAPQITLLQGLAKGEKMDFVIRHATELGVQRFVPLKFQRSVVKLDEKKAAQRVQRWNAIAKSAAMQSGQTRLPQVEAPQTLRQFCDCAAQAAALQPSRPAYDAVLICWEEASCAQSLAQALKRVRSRAAQGEPSECSPVRIAVVVGPEGGIAPEEVDALLGVENASLVSLGSSILRTETAGIVAPALVLFALGQLGGPDVGAVD